MQRHFLSVAAIVAVLGLVSGCQKQDSNQHPSMFKKVLTEDSKVGTGPAADNKDYVFIQYTGKLAKSGVQFDSNDPEKTGKTKNPLGFLIGPGSDVIPGLIIGVKGMKVGGERKVSVPWFAAYGATGNEGIPPFADLVFDVKLLYIVKAGEESDVTVDDLTVGTGEALRPNDKVEVHYIGKFVNDRVFDSTYDRKKTVPFQMGKGEVISGFEKGIEGMKVGGKRRITLAPGAGWGMYGNDVIPGGAVTIYDVELVSVKHTGS